jgi:type IV pilus assembly protein PilV
MSIMKTLERSQSGIVLLEALIGILIFSLGVLSMVALGATAVTVQADAQYRTEAMNLAERDLSQIWTGVDRTQDHQWVTCPW